MPVIRVVPLATAARTEAVRKASVMGSMSTCAMAFREPTGGPTTVVVESVWVTEHPIGRSTSTAKRASPCRDLDPMFGMVHFVR